MAINDYYLSQLAGLAQYDPQQAGFANAHQIVLQRQREQELFEKKMQEELKLRRKQADEEKTQQLLLLED